MKLIDKDKVVTKIKKRFDEYTSSILKHYDACKEARAQELGKILTIINAIEAKEVDLEKEIGKYLDTNDIEFSHQIKLLDFAKHFYELGLKSQKGE